MLTSRVVIRNGMVKDTWKEEDHPRSKSGPTAGQFIKKGTSSVGSVKEKKVSKPVSKKTDKTVQHKEIESYAGKEVRHRRFENKDFKDVSLLGSNFSDCRFFNSDFEGVKFDGSSFLRSKFESSNLKADFSNTHLIRQKNINCDFKGANFSNAHIDCVVFDNCDLTNIDFRETQIKRVSFANSKIKGAKFGDKINLLNIDFREADMEGFDITFLIDRGEKLENFILAKNLDKALYKGGRLPKTLVKQIKDMISIKEDLLGLETMRDYKYSTLTTRDVVIKNKEKVQADVSKKSGINPKRVRDLVSAWAETSSDHNKDSVRAQLTAKKLFDLKEAKTEHMPPIAIHEVSSEYPTKQYERFLKAQYDLTQEYFKKKGIKELVVYRGVGNSYMPSRDTHVALQPMSSCSLTYDVAENFGHHVMMMKVPVEDILSIPLTGYGCTNEHEVVILGGIKKVENAYEKSILDLYA